MKGGLRVELGFVTKNRHKFEEAFDAFKEFHTIKLVQIKMNKPENKVDELVYSDDPIYLIAEHAAKELSITLKLPVVVEDSGIFFKAYKNFPGLNTKWLIKSIGYKGIFKLLESDDRSAYFRSVVSCCFPGSPPLTFEGRVNGRISNRVINDNIDCMDYDRIFIPEGYEEEFTLIMDVKRKISHRKIAFNELGKYFSARS